MDEPSVSSSFLFSPALVSLLSHSRNFATPRGLASNFSSGCDFMMGLGKPKLHTKFEVVSLSCCRNIKGELHNFRELPSP